MAKKCKYESEEATFVPIDSQTFDNGKTYRGYWAIDKMPGCTKFESLSEQIARRSGYLACGGCGKKCGYYVPVKVPVSKAKTGQKVETWTKKQSAKL
jgi:hypothetical protein